MDGKKQEKEVTEEPKRFTMQEMARGHSLFVEALFLQQLFREQSSATVSSMMKKESYYPDITGSFFQEARWN